LVDAIDLNDSRSSITRLRFEDQAMPRAIWNGVVIAESDRCEVVEGNQYFPPDSIKTEYFKPTDRQTSCFWKGTASYYTLEMDGETASNAAWTYAEPKDAAQNIKGYVAFYRNHVTIES
jgi:uncharacterized protein (DUF427 family)